VLRERVSEYFQLRPEEDSPYMLLVAPVARDKRTRHDGPNEGLRGFEKLKPARSVVPAVTHVDYSARVQTVDPKRHGRFYRLIKCFEERTGCPLVINTSFNVRGEPIVCTPEDAYRCFMATDMDALVMERFLLLKRQQPHAEEFDVETYLAQFPPD